MRVLIDALSCDVSLRDDRMLIAADGSSRSIDLVRIAKVMVNRKSELKVRLLLDDGSAVNAAFEGTQDRDTVIKAVAAFHQSSKSAVKAESTADTESVPLSKTIKEELAQLSSNDASRGCVYVLEAVNSLIDSATLQLKPITEQMEADVLRQNPQLADVFARRVSGPDERRDFWEAVVRTFFCFSKSFLDSELVRPVAADASSDVASAVTVASAAALPFDVSAAPDTEPPVHAPSPAAHEATEAHGRVRHALYPTLVSRKRSRAPACFTAQSCGGTSHDVDATSQIQERCDVVFQVPESAKNDKVIKLLRSFWTSTSRRHDSSLPGAAGPSDVANELSAALQELTPGSVMATCVVSALRNCE